jgi:hypothetical protein
MKFPNLASAVRNPALSDAEVAAIRTRPARLRRLPRTAPTTQYRPVARREPSTAVRAHPARDRQAQALQGVNEGPRCPGCGMAFTPIRTTQKHCRPSCRVMALRRRRESVNAPPPKRARAQAQAQHPHIGAVQAITPAPGIAPAQAPGPATGTVTGTVTGTGTGKAVAHG